ncbi:MULTISPECIES: type VI immunity family protein [unclassified Variovorax]|uniref:type VI immunity family protein n=1 Tax=unclassified Variovorax TaxID=663243 RepID=UPI003F45298D
MATFEHIAVNLTDGFGNELLRTGMVVTYFLDDEHASHAGVAGAAMLDFAQRFMAGRPVHFPDDDVFAQADATDLRALLDDRVVRAAVPPKFTLVDSAVAAPRFSATYCGMDRAHLANIGWPHTACGLRFTFSLEDMDENGLFDIFEFAGRWARALPLASGYVAPAFVCRESAEEIVAFQGIARLCRRYRCMDIPALLVDCFEVGAGVKGAYWCNFLGRRALAEVGGEARLRAAFAGTGARVESIGGIGGIDEERLSVALEPLPIFGDVNRRQDLGLYRWAHGLFAPALRPRTVAYLGFDEESMQAWLHRFAQGDA